MKNVYLSCISLLLALTIASCGGGTEQATTKPETTNSMPADDGASASDVIKKTDEGAAKTASLSTVVSSDKVTGMQDLTGYYVGMFGPNKINLIISEIDEHKIKGHTVVSGNDRPFEGTVAANGTQYAIKAAEPGTDTYDGKFDVVLDSKGAKNTIVLKGNWVANTKKYGKKTFTLTKTTFAYNPKLGMYPQASTKALVESDVENLTKHDITIMRNEIYARHGYCFKNKDMRNYFDGEEWYMPMTIDIRNNLSPIEKENEVLLKRYEKYAQDYYDDYGR